VEITPPVETIETPIRTTAFTFPISMKQRDSHDVLLTKVHMLTQLFYSHEFVYVRHHFFWQGCTTETVKMS
jgi:hypothetical protein